VEAVPLLGFPPSRVRHFLWVFSNFFGYIFGRAFLAPIHKVIVHLGVHALGYDNMYRDSWTGEEWFIRKILAPTHPTVCLDIGANVGNYTRKLLKYTQARVIAVEPLPAAYAALQELGDRVTTVQAAISDFDGEAPIFHAAEIDGMASLDSAIRKDGKQTVVKVLTLQSLVAEQGLTQVDFIKIDTEGFEREALKKLGTLRPAFVQFEFNIHHLIKNCTLHEICGLLPGYAFYRLLPHGWLKMDPEKYVDNLFMFCNIVAVRTL
jgi:FkbM family methyltransferase